MGHHDNDSLLDKVKDALGFGDRDHDHGDHHDHDPASTAAAGPTSAGATFEEHHAADSTDATDAPIHRDDAASSVEANLTRPAGPDYGAEDAALRGPDDRV